MKDLHVQFLSQDYLPTEKHDDFDTETLQLRTMRETYPCVVKQALTRSFNELSLSTTHLTYMNSSLVPDTPLDVYPTLNYQKRGHLFKNCSPVDQ